MKRSRILVLSVILTLLLASSSGVANPGGKGDSNRDFTCGGSCHGDPSLSSPSSADIQIDMKSTAFSGTATAVSISISGMDLSDNRLVGIFLLGSKNGNDDHPEDHGWQIIQDPNGGTSNYVEVVSSDASVTANWVLLAPIEEGVKEIFASIHHGSMYNPDNKAFSGETEGFIVNIDPIPENYPTLKEGWLSPDSRVSGDSSAIIIKTVNTESLSVLWKLSGESQSHEASVDMVADQEWEVLLPATLGDTRIEYQIIASKGDFSNQMPWLSMGTSEPYFDGTSLGAKLQSFSFTLIILGFMLSLQAWFAPRGVRKLIDNTNEVEELISEEDSDYWSRLIASDENPGWLWDPIEKKWVADPNFSGDEQ
ncbi:MAG: hypothetical protein OR994_07095 [Candidatus Poseidoniales archaeon]|jgi:hypothetical protein|nr:hypothetical protein [Candidatus Poseidoniales archaeon]|tara:strand:- start:2921 stop:4021 length:1101 start_codon:yes stop_codon:yes gene_type:complete